MQAHCHFPASVLKSVKFGNGQWRHCCETSSQAAPVGQVVTVVVVDPVVVPVVAPVVVPVEVVDPLVDADQKTKSW